MTRLPISLLLIGALISPTAMAGEIDDAEVVRLRTEMTRLAERSAWAGVERAYVALAGSGVELSYEDHFAGAQAAKALGDISAMRTRLLAANAVQESQDVMDWLFAVDSNFGEVQLTARANGPELAAVQKPFAADQRAAVAFAAKSVEETGSYVGYLPSGSYTFGSETFQVLPRVAPVVVDLRQAGGSGERDQPTPEPAAPKPKPTPKPVAGGGEVTPTPDSDDVGMLSLHLGAGTSYGWVGVGGIAHFGPVGLRVAGGYDPVFGIPSGQVGARVYPAGFGDAGPAKVAPMLEVAFAPIRWKEVGKALYGPAVSVGAEAVISGFAIDAQVGAGVTRDNVRGLTRPGVLVGLGVGYNFL